jgi:hypothetical protein
MRSLLAQTPIISATPVRQADGKVEGAVSYVRMGFINQRKESLSANHAGRMKTPFSVRGALLHTRVSVESGFIEIRELDREGNVFHARLGCNAMEIMF